jgi:methyl-accepting chemotaxis protein
MGESTSAGEDTRRQIVRRRIVVVDKQMQYRSAAMVTGLVAVLLVFINAALFAMRRTQTDLLTSTAPELGEVLEAGNIRLATLAIVLSVVVLVFVWFATILATHRTAGAIVGLRRRLESVRGGNYHAVLRLRPNDNLRSLESPFNQMMANLRGIFKDDAAALSELADRFEAGGGPAEAVQALRDRAVIIASRVDRGSGS